MTKHSYQLINPVIEGTFKSVYDAKNPLDAANSMWSNLSQHIIAHVPKFMFTMQDISSGELHHFEVSENRKNQSGGDVSFTIDKLNLSLDKSEFDEFAKKIDQYERNSQEHAEKMDKQEGGRRRKRYDDDSSSTTSSTDIPYLRRTSPIGMFHYNTRVYFTNYKTYPSLLNPQVVAVSTPIFTPIFKPILGTYIGIWP